MAGVKIQEYDLHDAALLHSEIDWEYLVWIPSEISIILGASNQPERDLHLDTITGDNIPVYKRPSGGETVLISPETIVISITEHPIPLIGVKKQFHRYNKLIIQGLSELGVTSVTNRGISDLAIGDKKILGSALYHSRDRVFYHAVLNIGESGELIEKYIKHPVREPDYRQGRSHADFIKSLREYGYDFPVRDYSNAIDRVLGRSV